jgi:hypothetical protein
VPSGTTPLNAFCVSVVYVCFAARPFLLCKSGKEQSLPSVDTPRMRAVACIQKHTDRLPCVPTRCTHVWDVAAGLRAAVGESGLQVLVWGCLLGPQFALFLIVLLLLCQSLLHGHVNKVWLNVFTRTKECVCVSAGCVAAGWIPGRRSHTCVGSRCKAACTPQPQACTHSWAAVQACRQRRV